MFVEIDHRWRSQYRILVCSGMILLRCVHHRAFVVIRCGNMKKRKISIPQLLFVSLFIILSLIFESVRRDEVFWGENGESTTTYGFPYVSRTVVFHGSSATWQYSNTHDRSAGRMNVGVAAVIALVPFIVVQRLRKGAKTKIRIKKESSSRSSCTHEGY